MAQKEKEGARNGFISAIPARSSRGSYTIDKMDRFTSGQKNNYMKFFLRIFPFLRLLVFCYIKMSFLLERRLDKRNGPEVFNGERGELQTEIFS